VIRPAGAGKSAGQYCLRRADTAIADRTDIKLASGESIVTRENNQRNLTIRIDNRDRDLTSYLNDAQAQDRGQQVHFDHDKIRLEWGGQFENQRRAESRLVWSFSDW
jgi:cobalt-zinc-cadmium resistance protein CzcA